MYEEVSTELATRKHLTSSWAHQLSQQTPKLREASDLLKTRRLADPSENSELPVHARTSPCGGCATRPEDVRYQRQSLAHTSHCAGKLAA